MPRGVPKAGYRMTKKRQAQMKGGTPVSFQKNGLVQQVPTEVEQTETDAEIFARLQDRFEVIDEMTVDAVNGTAKALIVSGPAGLGKSFTVEQALEAWDPEGNNYSIIKGYVKATGLYKELYSHRNEGKVLVFDDADTIFNDETALNMLKAVCDTTERRVVSYLAEFNMVDEESADIIPRSFEFKGTIIFITNIDFDRAIEGGSKIANHLEALISRSYYVDCGMKTRRDYMIRIKQVCEQGLLSRRGLNSRQQKAVLDFIADNTDDLRELSLRIAIKVGDMIAAHPNNWERRARITCLRNR